MASTLTASIFPISPSELFSDGFELTDQQIIPSVDFTGSFDPEINNVEFYIYDANVSLLYQDTNFEDWSITQNSNTSGLTDTDNIELNPIKNISDIGFDDGSVYAIYNFINRELSSSPSSLYYLSEISTDRTEIRIKSNFISNEEIQASFNLLKSKLNSAEYFDEFYITFGSNEYHIGINLELDLTEEQSSVLIKLYDALPPQYNLKDQLYVVTKVGESVAYKVDYPQDLSLLLDVTYLQGPNTNLDIKDFVNNSTELKSKSELLNTPSSSSLFNLQSILNEKGVTIAPNYSYDTFNEFVNFSSAKKRIQNFVEKVELIQTYESNIASLSTITGPTSQSFQVSSSIASAYTNIENIIKNFDGYEYFLYYSTGSSSYPKTGSAFPYTLLPTTDVSVSVWLGSDVETDLYYGGILLSASFYDNNNQNWLYYTIPEFIRDNSNNDQYIEFANMVGQHFDEIWLYSKTVTEKLNSTNELDNGVPLELADAVITSFGFRGLANNYNNEGNFIGLVGENDGDYLPPTGSELITQYIAVNGPSVLNYWVPPYGYDYVQAINNPGWPYAIDDVSKEIFKRLYHNMSYLVKKKGTIAGLRQLINIWGIPNTILRISEFGGKNKDNSDDYDLWYNRYSYAFNGLANFQNVPSASVRIPWMPLERNRVVDSQYIVPDNIQFRFKTTGYPSSSYAGEFFTQSLLVKKSDGDATSTDFDFGIALFYTGSASGSYSGSSSSEYQDWGVMRLYISGSAANGGTAISDDIFLPFFNKGWWSVMVQRNQHVSASDNTKSTVYTLYAKNNIYNGYDGNSIGFEGSASIVSNISASVNEAWNKFGTGSADGIYLGGFVSGSVVGTETIGVPGKMFSGSLQEFRYYSYAISESIFNDFVMNPESIEGENITGSQSSFDIVNFRAPLGNELESIFSSSLSSSYTESMSSYHPAVTASAPEFITESFVNPVTNTSSSLFDIIYYDNTSTKVYSETNTEVYFLDQPAVGLRNRISNKIQVADTSDFGTILSNQISIQQDYQISRSYTEDINSLEVAFSPQDEVNDNIIQTFGFGVVADTLADPRAISESANYYPQLRRVAEDYFKKYTKGNIYDYIRLIKYFDNSIFKAIKTYVPARTSVTTGIVIKQHLLERNRYREPQITQNTQIAVTPSGAFNTPIIYQNLELTSSIEVGSVTGSTGGVLNPYNYSGSASFGQTPITQSWDNTFDTVVGAQTITESYQEEFYDGEYSGSEFASTTQSLNPNNPYKGSDSTYASSSLYYLNVYALGNVVAGESVTITGSAGSITATVVDGISNVNFAGRNDMTIAVLSNLSGPFPVTGSLPQSFSLVGTITDMDEVFYFEYTGTPKFVYNDNNAIINNYNDNRNNTFLYDLDYALNAKTPVNLTAVVNKTATKAQTPDSNYTARRVTYPRYEGSKVISLDYNNYSPAGVIAPPTTYIPKISSSLPPYFLNGDSGSWSGDDAYGKSAAIDKYPRYIARFKTSIENYSLWNTYQYNLDQLIEIPQEDITGNKNYEPVSLKVDGSNKELLAVTSTFEKGRKVTPVYDTVKLSGVDYSTFKVGNYAIFQGGLEFLTLNTNQKDRNNPSTKWAYSKKGLPYEGTQSKQEVQMLTGSNCFILRGAETDVSFSVWSDGGNGYVDFVPGTNLSKVSYYTQLAGPQLAVMHTYNYYLKNQFTNLFFAPASPFVSLYVDPGTNPTDPSNYFSFIPSSSEAGTYEFANTPFIIERGDEIRIQVVQAQTSGKSIVGSIVKTFDFTVLEVSSSDYPSGSVLNTFAWCGATGGFPVCAFKGVSSFAASVQSQIYDRLIVTPDPSTLQIPDGEITQFTIRRRSEADDRVLINTIPPTGSEGASTKSGGGYLIPSDLSIQQKANAINIINNLKAKNAFRNDDTVI